MARFASTQNLLAGGALIMLACATANDDYFNIGLEPVPTAEKPGF